MRLYIITGGPGTGKTTLMQEIENRKKYMVIKEAAKDVILQEQAKGIQEPWEESDFQEKVTGLQLQREAAIPDGNGIVFLDRGIPDGLAYCKFRNQKVPRNLYLAMKECDYEKVFFLEPLPNYEKTDFRAENEEDAHTVANLIKQTYQQLGYEIIDVPVMDLAERADFVIKNL